MIGRADIEGSKSNVAMNAWLPQVSSFIPFSTRISPSFDEPCFRVWHSTTCTFSSGSSPYLKQRRSLPTPYRALSRSKNRLLVIKVRNIFRVVSLNDFPASRHVAEWNAISMRLGGKPPRTVVYPCGNFSDTSTLKPVKTKDQ